MPARCSSSSALAARLASHKLLQRRDILFEAGECIEQPPVGRRIDQRALVMLAVNLHQRGADRLQGLHADRLVVDEGAGPAIGKLHPAQDHLAGIVEAIVAEDGAWPDVASGHRTPR